MLIQRELSRIPPRYFLKWRDSFEKKKLLFVIDSLGCGGAEKSLVSLLSLVDYSRCEVHLQMFSSEGMFMKLLPEQVLILPEFPYMRFCREGGGNVRWYMVRLLTFLGLRLKPKFKGFKLHDSQIYWKYAGRAYDALPENYDAAIAWGQGSPTYFVAEKVSAKRRLAVVNANLEVGGHERHFDAMYYGKYDCIAAVSDALQEILKQTYPAWQDKIKTLYDIRNQSLTEQMACEFDPFPNRGSFPVLTTVGRMVPAKGYDLAVEAAGLLKARGLAFQWYLIGNGPALSGIRTMIDQKGLSDMMFAIGEKENPYPYMKHADVYVQTSRSEGYCLTLSEARGLHTPPVSTNFEAVHNQLRHGENGLIVEMTPQSIADGIETMLRDDALRESIRNTLCRERVGNEEEIEKFYNLVECL